MRWRGLFWPGLESVTLCSAAVGGNHEAANHLHELYYGGWAAPNIFYMGAANVINFGGARIAGITGIYKGHDYSCGHHELPPYNNSSVRSAYHVRDLDVYRLLKVRSPGILSGYLEPLSVRSDFSQPTTSSSFESFVVSRPRPRRHCCGSCGV